MNNFAIVIVRVSSSFLYLYAEVTHKRNRRSEDDMRVELEADSKTADHQSKGKKSIQEKGYKHFY